MFAVVLEQVEQPHAVAQLTVFGQPAPDPAIAAGWVKGEDIDGFPSAFERIRLRMSMAAV